MKTDKQDAITIFNYGLDHWYRLKDYEAEESVYAELKLLEGSTVTHMRMRGERFGTDPSCGLLNAWDQNIIERLE